MSSYARAEIVFRVDASLKIGTGHVRRCITLADELRRRGARCRFITRAHPGHLRRDIEGEGFEVLSLPASGEATAPWSDGDPIYAGWLGADWLTDAQETQRVLQGSRPNWMVVDHYALDARWEASVRSSTDSLMVIDDLANRVHDCDLLVDVSLGRKCEDYGPWMTRECRRLLGTAYALLRPEFAGLRQRSLDRRREPALQHVLVAMGGVDQPNATGSVLTALEARGLEDLEVTVVLGAHAPWLEQVREQAADMKLPTRLLIDTRDMASLLCESDLAIGAAGVSALERCCLGVPSLLVVLAENQRNGACMLQGAGAACLLGDSRDASQRVGGELDRLRADVGELARLSRNAREIVDGHGASRVAQEMLLSHA